MVPYHVDVRLYSGYSYMYLWFDYSSITDCSRAITSPFWVNLERVHITNISASVLARLGEIDKVSGMARGHPRKLYTHRRLDVSNRATINNSEDN